MPILKVSSLKRSGPVSWCTVSSGDPEKVMKVKALWDSGAEGTFLSKKVAGALNLPILGETTATLAGGEVVKGYFSQVDLMFSESVSFQRHSIVVIDMDREDEEDLVIGMDLFWQGIFHMVPKGETLEFMFIMP